MANYGNSFPKRKKTMKKKMISLLTLCALCAGVSAQTVTVADVEALPGETVAFTLNLQDGKASTYTSLQFNAQFPTTGFTTTGDYTISSAWKNASATVGDVDATGLAVVPVSSAEVITGSDVDNLFTVYFTVGSDVAVNDYEVTLSNITFGYGFTDKDIAPDVTFTVHVVSVHTVVLDETSTTAPEASNGAVNVRVLRTIKANEWSTICLPFAMTEAQVKAAFGDDVQIGDFNGYVYDDDAETITVNFKNATAIEANHPYIIKVSSKVEEFAAYGVEIDPEEEPMVNKGTSRKPKAIIGTYAANTVIGNGCLFLNGNRFWYSVGNTKTKAYRAYFDFYDLLPDFEDNYAESRISMSFDSSTAIDEIANRRLSDGECFDLQGRRLSGSNESVDIHKVSPYRKGLYIVNGKKVIK